MANELFVRSRRRVARHFLPLSVWLFTSVSPAAQNPAPPAEPAVPPLIARAYSGDQDGDRIEDQLARKLQAAETARARAATKSDQTTAQARLAARVEVELIFDRQITQRQLDEFRSLGGEVTHLYEAVSYGWNGRLPLGQVRALLARMGDSLVQVEEAKPAELHLDLATRTGRVRPVWAAGFAGNPSGLDGSTNITIGIVDSGVDESHVDLNGRRMFWHDYSTDGAVNPVDLVQHGTHVLGIALGTGAAAGPASGPLLFSDEGSLSGVANGSFFPSPFNLPSASVNVILVATWQGGGNATLNLLYHTRGVSGGWTVQGSGVTGASPLTLNLNFSSSPTRIYSPALLSNGSMSNYVTTVSASAFPTLGDGFNKLRGVAPECNWAAAKTFTSTGSGSSTTINAGIDGLVANRVANNIKVMNISLGITGDPGLSTSQRQKVNSAVNNGIVVVCSAGNDGLKATAAQREMDDPGRAALALTVAASDDNNQLTDYTSSGFSSPGSSSGFEEDYKPDLMAPGGSSTYYSAIMSVDSNSGDGTEFPDQRTNDYYNIQGTSMSSPFAAGCAALVIDALQQAGTNWSFSSSAHPRLVKMLLCATASESNANRDSGANNPTLQRNTAGPSGFPIGKDSYEGYGMINADAAIEAALVPYTNGVPESGLLLSTASDRRVWARSVALPGGAEFAVALSVPGSGDFDLYLYSRTPSAYGTPVLLASSAQAGNGVGESISYTPATATNVLLVVKRVSGAGNFTLVPNSLPTANFTGSPLGGSAPLTVNFTNTSSGASSYFWDFGDGNFSSSPNPANTYTNPGSYSVSLAAISATSTNVLLRTDYVVVTNTVPPLADFAATPTSGGAPLAVAFVNLSTGATNYLWDFGNGQTSSAINPVANYVTAGVYSVSLTAVGALGTNVFTQADYVLVTNLPPVITVQPQDQTVNLGANTSFSVTAGGTPPLNYQWRRWGTNLPAATASVYNIINAQLSDAGEYSVVVSSVAGSVTSSVATLSVLVLSGVIPVSGSPYTENFDALGASGSATPYGWYVGTGTGAIASTNVVSGNGSDNNAGNYNFGSTGGNDRALGSLAGNATRRCTEVRFINVSDYDITSLNISYTGEQWRVGGNGGVNNDLVLQYSTDGINFVVLGPQFNFNTPVDSGPASSLDGNAPANRVPGISGSFAPANPITSGQVFYLRWADDDSGSLDHGLAVDDVVVGFELALPAPEADFSISADSGVAPLTVQFTNLSAHASAYLWDFGDGQTSPATDPINTYSNAGSYTVSLVAMSAAGTNVLVRSDLILVTNLPPVVADFAADVTSGLAPLTVTFTNLSVNATTFVWELGDGQLSTEIDPIVTYTNAGNYTVSLIAIGPSGSNVLTRTDYIVVSNQPPLLVTPGDPIDFGTLFTGTVAQASLVVSNAGGSNLNGSAALAADPFGLLDADSHLVSSLGFVLPPKSETNLVLQFAPMTAGVFSNVVVLLSDGGNVTQPVLGRAQGTPVLMDLALNPPEFAFSFETVSGLIYEVQFKDQLEDVIWQSLTTLVGDGTVQTVTNVVNSPAQRYYRLSVE